MIKFKNEGQKSEGVIRHKITRIILPLMIPIIGICSTALIKPFSTGGSDPVYLEAVVIGTSTNTTTTSTMTTATTKTTKTNKTTDTTVTNTTTTVVTSTKKKSSKTSSKTTTKTERTTTIDEVVDIETEDTDVSTEELVEETTTTVKEEPSEEVTTETEINEEIDKEKEEVVETVVFKPSTKYVHRSMCHWVDDTCYDVTSDDGITAYVCSECNPDIDVTVLEKPVSNIPSTVIEVTEYEYISLCNLVAGEYGSDWVSVYDKGAVVACVIHRMWDGRWGGTDIISVINAPGQFDAKYCASYYTSKVTQSCKDAVTYALNNMDDYEYYVDPWGTSHYNIMSFWGDGTYNYFR